MMNAETCNYVMELEEILEDAEDRNDFLRIEMDELKDKLIETLLELNQYQKENICMLLDIIESDEYMEVTND